MPPLFCYGTKPALSSHLMRILLPLWPKKSHNQEYIQHLKMLYTKIQIVLWNGEGIDVIAITSTQACQTGI